MGNLNRETLVKIWGSANPFSSFPAKLYQVDAQGWNSQHSYLSTAIEQFRPSIVVEVGVWKGGSSLFMANRMRELDLDATVISIDTWLGSWDHWLNAELFQELAFNNGYPNLFYKFMTNVIDAELEDFIIPLPLDSVNARNFLSHRRVVADIIHIDGGHDYDAVTSDLEQWWQVLRPGGLFIGDDYNDDGRWAEVKMAVDNFLAKNAHSDFKFVAGKCWAKKL